MALSSGAKWFKIPQNVWVSHSVMREIMTQKGF